MSVATAPRTVPVSAPAGAPARPWLAYFGTILGAFMAMLDIQITNSSMSEIQAALGATLDEGSWITTSYLVAEIIVIPLSGWLSRVVGTKRYLMWNAGLFLFFSLCCAWAWDLNSMIVFRALQGFTGGVLIPIALYTLIMFIPESQRSIGGAIWGITATFAPTIGPTVGGWLTENLGWQYLFYLNIVPGVLLFLIVGYAYPASNAQWSLFKQGDWGGIAAIAIGLAALQIVLEEGNRDDWFGSTLIIRLSIIAVVSLSIFLYIQLTRANPLINLKLLGQRNFAFASIVNVVVGMSMYGSVFILPLYLIQIQGYNAMQVGEVMMWFGVPQLLVIPFIPKLLALVGPRLLVSCGVLLFSASCFMNTCLSHDAGMDQLIWTNVVRALGQPLVMVPLTSVAIAGIPQKDAGSASGLFNMMRNLGGSLGISLLATILSQRERFHSNRLGEAVSLFGTDTQARLASVAHTLVARGLDPATASAKATGLLDLTVRRESYIMAFNDCFLLLAFILAAAGIAIWGVKPAKSAHAPELVLE